MTAHMSDINICNMALANIGILPIVSFDEQTQQARLCSSFYGHLRDYLQASHSWGFNRKQCQLVKDLEYKSPNWQFAYAYPKDVLSVVRLYSAGGDEPQEAKARWGGDAEQQGFSRTLFEIQAGDKKRICTDIDSAWAEVRYRIEDVSMFPIGFSEALTWALSVRVALALTKSDEVANNAKDMFQRTLAMATLVDTGEGYGFDEQPTSWVQSRE